jgi:hypothetical protein
MVETVGMSISVLYGILRYRPEAVSPIDTSSLTLHGRPMEFSDISYRSNVMRLAFCLDSPPRGHKS